MALFVAFSDRRPHFLIEADSAAQAQANADLLALDGEFIGTFRKPVENLADETAARAAFWDAMEGEEFIDNVRTAYVDDAAQVAAYEAQEAQGCCGSADLAFLAGGRIFLMGCNYGH